jgi:uncharacterized OsmC-like protein
MKDTDQKSLVRATKRSRTGEGEHKSVVHVEVSWNFAEARPEFWPTLSQSEEDDGVKSHGASVSVEQAKPDPNQYWLFGIAASYAATFVELARLRDVEVRSLKIVAQGRLRPVALEELIERPLIDQVGLKLVVDTNADVDALTRLESMARKLCPGAYYLANPVKVEAGLEQAN